MRSRNPILLGASATMGFAAPFLDACIGVFVNRQKDRDPFKWTKRLSRSGTILFTVGLAIAVAVPIPGLSFLYTGSVLLGMGIVYGGVGVARALCIGIGATVDCIRGYRYSQGRNISKSRYASFYADKALNMMFFGEVNTLRQSRRGEPGLLKRLGIFLGLMDYPEETSEISRSPTVSISKSSSQTSIDSALKAAQVEGTLTSPPSSPDSSTKKIPTNQFKHSPNGGDQRVFGNNSQGGSVDEQPASCFGALCRKLTGR